MEKHVELFKKIPCGNFNWDTRFFRNLFNTPPELVKNTDIVMAYYYISREMMDKDSQFIVQKAPFDKSYDIHNPITEKHEIHKSGKSLPKLFRGVFKHNCISIKEPSVQRYGLTIKSSENIDISDFCLYALLYKSETFRIDQFTGETSDCVSDEKINHLYNMLKAMMKKGKFEYKQHGSIVLATEMATILANEGIFIETMRLPNFYHKKHELLKIIHQHKLLMFGELQKQY